MKTFQMTIPQNLRLNNKKLGATALLCGKSWVVFNDEGKTIEMIFQKDGGLIVSIDGDVSNSRWECLKENRKILLMTDRDTATMYQLYFQNNIFIALKVSDQERYMILIDKEYPACLVPQTLSALQAYFDSRYFDRENEPIDADKERSVKIDPPSPNYIKHYWIHTIDDKPDVSMWYSIRAELERDEQFQYEMENQVSAGKKVYKNCFKTGVTLLIISIISLCLIGLGAILFKAISAISFIGAILFFVIATNAYNPNQKEDIIKQKITSIIKERRK